MASPSLQALQTESRNADSSEIDVVSTLDICRIINSEDSIVAPAVQTCLQSIAEVIDLIVDRVRRGGRVIYIGAGTSGRLGVIDASEIPPTFSAPYSQFIALIAGGDSALRRATEGAEDTLDQPIKDLGEITPPLTSLDTLLGIAASGRTPYVLSGLSYCRTSWKMFTVGISCVRPSAMRGRCDRVIECVVGPEVVTGSTRMKAGTATKLILNMISTGVMIRTGKTHGNLMVDLKVSNTKLVDRARRIFRIVLPEQHHSDSEIDELISSCQGSVKAALVVAKLGCSYHEALKRLDEAGGILKRAWHSLSTVDPISTTPTQIEAKFVLCIDAGGTKCVAVIASNNGIIARAEGGPSNFVTLGHNAALSTISATVSHAIASLPCALLPNGLSPILPLHQAIFASVWIGAAGLGRQADLEAVKPRFLTLFAISDPSTLHITNDAALLSAAFIDRTGNTETKQGVAVVIGTGSVAFSYRISVSGRRLSTLTLGRAGGWGYLLGDEGSAYFVGREALRKALRRRDLGLPPTSLDQAIVQRFGCHSVGSIISAVYAPNRSSEQMDISSLDSDPKLRIATLCPLVFKAAFPESRNEVDMDAFSIVEQAALSIAEDILRLLQGGDGVTAKDTTLAIGGALSHISHFRTMILQRLEKQGEIFGRVDHIWDPASVAGQLLARQFLA